MPKKHQPKITPEVLHVVQKSLKESIVELEQRIRWAAYRTVPSPGGSRLAKEQRRFWSSIKADFEAVRATYLVALKHLERAEAELGLTTPCLAICARLAASLKERLASSTRLDVKAWPASVLERTAEAALVVHPNPKRRWMTLVFLSVTYTTDGKYDISSSASMRLYNHEVDLRSRRLEEAMTKYGKKYGAKAAVGESYDSLQGDPWLGTTLSIIFPIASSSYDAKDFDAEQVADELARSAAERLPEMEKLCKELVGADLR